MTDFQKGLISGVVGYIVIGGAIGAAIAVLAELQARNLERRRRVVDDVIAAAERAANGGDHAR